VQYAAFERALEAKADFLTHTPLDTTLDESIISRMVAQKTIAIPTLIMMEMVVANRKLPRAAYHAARDSVTAFYKAGIPILASTDANSQPGVPAQPKHGESLHHELVLMVEAGVSNLDVLRAATVVPAGYFGLGDRGSIRVGKRADLVLVEGNPLEDIRATRNIQRVWCGGTEVKGLREL
jgi:imidazolonepropionase-like amidohydrolase